MTIQLSDHFTYKRLLRFVLPSVVMLIFTSIYGVVDGLFVSNYVGKIPFAALNLIFPALQALGALGFMLGTGGSALVAKLMGEGKHQKANEVFSLLTYVTIGLGLAVSVLGMIFIRPLALLLGATEEMLPYCVLYGRILLAANTCFMLQVQFQSFMVTAEKPGLGLVITTAAGVTNMVLDWLFIAVFGWGLAGAAAATALSQAVGGLSPLFYFIWTRKSPLRLGKARLDGQALKHTCLNGSSEMLTNLSMSLVSMLYNFQLLRFAGEDGVAAYGVLMYLSFVFLAIFIGYSVGSAPIISYHYGAQNHGELQNLTRKSLVILALSALIMTGLGISLAGPLSGIFVGYDAGLLAMTRRAMTIYSLSFLVTGFNIYGSAFFTALNNGPVSAAISFLRTLVFQIIAVFLLPLVWGLDGIWFAVLAAEGAALAVTCWFFVRLKSRYHY